MVRSVVDFDYPAEPAMKKNRPCWILNENFYKLLKLILFQHFPIFL